MLHPILKGARWTVLVPVLLIGAFGLVACGNDDDNGGPGGGGGTASDEQYVRAMCEASNDFFDEFLEAVFGAESEEESIELAAGAMRGFLNDLRGMGTPADVREHHDRFVDSLSVVVEQLEDGNIDALDTFEDDFEFPADVEERLAAVAEDIEECGDFDVF